MSEVTMNKKWFDKFCNEFVNSKSAAPKGPGDPSKCCIKGNDYGGCDCVDDGSFCNKQPDDRD